jgi:hypothetical protein
VNDRAVTPAVGKALEAAVVVLYVGLLTTTLYGGVVPEYRTATADELADRTVSGAADRVREVVPPEATAARSRTTVDLPATLGGEGYAVRVQNRTLVLDHPDAGVDARARLVLPGRVRRVRGEWDSRRPAVVLARQRETGVVLVLREGDP